MALPTTILSISPPSLFITLFGSSSFPPLPTALPSALHPLPAVSFPPRLLFAPLHLSLSPPRPFSAALPARYTSRGARCSPRSSLSYHKPRMPRPLLEIEIAAHANASRTAAALCPPIFPLRPALFPCNAHANGGIMSTVFPAFQVARPCPPRAPGTRATRGNFSIQANSKETSSFHVKF